MTAKTKATPAQASAAITQTRKSAAARQSQPKIDAVPKEATTCAAKAHAGKMGALVLLLRRPEGVSIDEMARATGWQRHSVRGAISGALKKKAGLTILSEYTDGGRIYRIPAGDGALRPRLRPRIAGPASAMRCGLWRASTY